MKMAHKQNKELSRIWKHRPEVTWTEAYLLAYSIYCMRRPSLVCIYNALRVAGGPARSFAHKEEWNGMTDVVDGPTF